MHSSLVPAALLLVSRPVSAAVHDLLVGTFGAPHVYSLAFDEEASTLSLAANISASSPSSWIALSHDKKALYGTAGSNSPPSFLSYTIENSTSLIENDTILSVGGDCSNSTAHAIFVIAAKEPPYNVYGVPFGSYAGCGAVMAVDQDTGALAEVVQNYTYTSASVSGAHGLALHPQGTVLYSADYEGEKLWAHSIDATTGELTFLSNVDAPSTKVEPRQLAVHPKAKYLYVVLESTSQLAQYSIDCDGLPSYTNVTYSLLPSGTSSSTFWADTVTISKTAKYVWATTRNRDTNSTGYISGYSLADDGKINSQLFLLPTTASGGSANAVTASEFSDDFVAITDSSANFVEIWKMAANGSSAAVAAHLDLYGGPANAVWLS